MGFEEGGVDGAAAFAEEFFHFPFAAKPLAGGGKIDLFAGGDVEGVGEFGEGGEFLFAGGFSGEDEDGAEAGLEDFGVWIDGAAAGDDDAEVGVGEALGAAFAEVFGPADVEGDGGEVDGSGAAHDGVVLGAEFVHEGVVAGGGEGDEAAVGGGDFAVGADGDVDGDEGAVPFHGGNMARGKMMSRSHLAL